MREVLTRFAAAAAILAGLGLSPARSQTRAPTIVVGSKNFTEQHILAEMTAQLLRSNGFTVDKRGAMASAALRRAQENAEVDAYWEYTGTSLITYNKISDRLSLEDTYRRVKEIDAEKGLIWLNPAKANNTFALVMNRDEAERRNIRTISDLARAVSGGGRITFVGNAEFVDRPGGLKPLQESYNFTFARPHVRRVNSGLPYAVLKDRLAEVALAFATDGRIAAYKFVVLEDDKGFFPSYSLAPVVRREILEAHPRIAELLNALAAKLDDETMAKLNASVEFENLDIGEVAFTFLRRLDLT